MRRRVQCVSLRLAQDCAEEHFTAKSVTGQASLQADISAAGKIEVRDWEKTIPGDDA